MINEDTYIQLPLPGEPLDLVAAALLARPAWMAEPHCTNLAVEFVVLPACPGKPPTLAEQAAVAVCRRCPVRAASTTPSNTTSWACGVAQPSASAPPSETRPVRLDLRALLALRCGDDSREIPSASSSHVSTSCSSIQRWNRATLAAAGCVLRLEGGEPVAANQ